IQQLVSAHLTGWKMDGVSLLRRQRERPPGRQGRDVAADVPVGQKNQRAGETFWRAGNDQCAFVVARQQKAGLCELPVAGALKACLHERRRAELPEALWT